MRLSFGSTFACVALLAPLAGALACNPDPTMVIEADRRGDPSPEPEAPEPDANPEPEGIVDPEARMATCKSDVVWSQDESEALYSAPTFFDITPNGGLIVASDSVSWSAQVLRTRDGALAAQEAWRQLDGTDANWRLQVQNQYSSVVVQDVITLETVHTFDVDGEGNNFAASALSASGDRVAALRCGTEGVWLLSFSATDGAEVGRVQLEQEGECPSWSGTPATVAFAQEGASIVAAIPASGQLHHWVPDTNALSSATVELAEEIAEEFEFLIDGPLLQFAVHPDGHRLAATYADGTLHQFKLPGLVEVGPTLDVGLMSVNFSVYANPRLTSPVAFAPDGESMAIVLDDETAVLVNPDTGEHLKVLGTGTLELEPEFDWLDEERARPVGFAFTDDARAVAVAFRGGVVLHGCDGFALPGGPTLAVILEGPSLVNVGEPAEFVATHLGSDEVHTHRFFIDDEPIWSNGFDRVASYYPTEPGTYSVRVVVDDGISQGETSMVVVVAEP